MPSSSSSHRWSMKYKRSINCRHPRGFSQKQHSVKKSKKKEWDARLERLREQVEYWTNPDNATEKTVEIVELFYDCD